MYNYIGEPVEICVRYFSAPLIIGPRHLSLLFPYLVLHSVRCINNTPVNNVNNVLINMLIM